MKKTRSRLKSTNSETQSTNEDQMANSNSGKEVVDKNEADEMSQEAPTESDVNSKIDEISEENVVEPSAVPEDKVMEKPHGRKRKASELKSGDMESEEANTVNDKVDFDSEGGMDSSNNETSKIEEPALESTLGSDGDISASIKQTLGKGKRARIPNKRYSDFPLKTSHSIIEPMEIEYSKENGEKENLEREAGSYSDLIKGDTSEHSSSAYSSPSVAVSALKGSRLSQVNSPSTPAKKIKLAVDISNPNYLKPFKYGWKRELVWRTTNDNNNKRNGDIYYYTPSGKKVRSMREVSENLKNKELTLEDFTFFKEPLGLDDPEKEIIRDAKVKSGTSTPASKKNTPKPVKKTTAAAVPSPKPAPAPVPDVVDEPKAKNSPRLTGFKIKLPTKASQSSKGKQSSRKKEKDDAELEANNWPIASSKKTPKSGNNDKNKPCQPCSIRCQGVIGLIPTLQCRICLCLYHNECVGLSPTSTIQGYVCKNCQLDQDSSAGNASTVAPPPPLTPINTLKSVTAQSSSLPKLQRIPKTSQSVSEQQIEPHSPLDALPPLVPRPPPLAQPVQEEPKESNVAPVSTNENRSLVGSFTTWFASNSSIQVNQKFGFENLPTVPPPRPQYVEYFGNKQFLVVPKHNIISISPTIAPISIPQVRPLETLSTISENAPVGETQPSTNPDSANLGATLTNEVEISQIKSEPFSPIKTPVDSANIGGCKDGESGVEGKVPEENSTSEIAPLELEENETVSTPKKTRRSGAAAGSVSSLSNSRAAAMKSEDVGMDNYLQSVAFGYSTLLHVFQYLKVQDLLRAGCVCSMWRDMASHVSLWKTVRMKNSQIHSFKGLANALEKHGTVHLDLRKMLLPSNSNDDIWQEFTTEIKKVDSLKKIELCRCPAGVVEQLAMSNPKLEVINAVTIKCESMNIAPIAYLPNLQELRLKSTSGFSLTSNLTALAELTQLKHLSLTSVKDLNELKISVIADLKNLESLDLGECVDFPRTFGSEILSKLNKLEKLRLEKGQGNCYTFEILEAVKNMKQLEQLELVNFDIKTGFDRALGACTNIKKLLIIPTYISQSATTNHMVLGGVLRLQSTLSHFVWGVTLELLRVTELFVDQCEDPEKKEKKEKKPISNGDSIPVLKPVPLLRDGLNVEIPPAQDPPQVEILPLPNLQKLLLQSLPTTRVKILKIPFHATWRQSITDTVN